MTTMSDAVGKVARLLGITKRSQQPTGHDAADLLDYVQGVFDRLPGFRSGQWTDVVLTTDAAYAAKDGERVILDGVDPVITIPAVYVDECGETRIPADLSRVHVIRDGIYVFSSTLGAWNKTDALALTDTFPFGDEDLPGIVAAAAIAASPEYSDADLKPIVFARAESMLASVTARFWRGLPNQTDRALLQEPYNRGSWAAWA